MVTAIASMAAYGESSGPSFPESHKHFLGAASYAAMFGQRAKPSSSATPPLAAQRSKGLVVESNVQVNEPQVAPPFGRSETSIAVARNGRSVVVGWNDAEGFLYDPFTSAPALGVAGYGYSTDGGDSFVDGGAPPIAPDPNAPDPFAGLVTRGDPSLDVSGKGNGTFYFANVAVYAAPGTNPGGTSAGISVHRGDFKGDVLVWDDPVLLFSPNYPNDFLDKPHIAADKRPPSDRVYVAVTNFAEVDGAPFSGFGRIEAYTSADAGLTWTRSIVQPDETIASGNQGVLNHGAQPAVGPDGTVYVAWERGLFFPFNAAVSPEIRVARSGDGGSHWEPAPALPPSSGVNPAGSLVSKICSGGVFPPSGYSRPTTNDYPRIAVAQTGQYRGRTYVAYQDCRIANGGPQPALPGPEDPGAEDVGHPDTDIYVRYSDDQGDTWSEAVLVAGGGDGNIQFWPTVSVQPNGSVDVTYYESFEPDGTEFLGTGTGTSLVDLYWAKSDDGGQTFEAPVKVSDVTSDWGAATSDIDPNFGDYNTAVSVGNTLFATWADGRNGVPDVFFARKKR